MIHAERESSGILPKVISIIKSVFTIYENNKPVAKDYFSYHRFTIYRERQKSMVEQPYACKRHCYTIFVASIDHMIVTD